MRKKLALVLATGALTLAGAANAAETGAPVALTDEQMDSVVAGDDHLTKQDPAPGAVVAVTGPDGSVTMVTGGANSDYPPPVVLVNGDHVNIQACTIC